VLVEVLYKKIILADRKDLPQKSQEGQKDTTFSILHLSLLVEQCFFNVK
jgi:hypothetical protein